MEDANDKYEASIELRTKVLLSANRALLGAVTQHLRAVTVNYNKQSLTLRAHFDNGASQEDKELINVALAEMSADLWQEIEQFHYEPFDLPAPIKMELLKDWLYIREENSKEILYADTEMKNDIADRKDIELLMEVFYQKLLNDPGISYIFIEVAKIDLPHHLPIITDFWESVLLDKNVYHNNTMKIHMDLNAKSKLSKEHFTIWLAHFHQTVDELFEGKTANRAKQRATSVATIMQIKIAQGA